MSSISMRAGDRLTLGDGTVIRVDGAQDGRVRLRVQAAEETCVVRGAPPQPSRQELRELAQDIASGLSSLESAHSQALLSEFVSELFRSAAELDRRAQRRQKQAQGIVEAKTRGVRFGRPAAPLPDGFEQARRDWQEGRLTVREAADACGMSHSSFYYAATRKRAEEEQAV